MRAVRKFITKELCVYKVLFTSVISSVAVGRAVCTVGYVSQLRMAYRVFTLKGGNHERLRSLASWCIKSVV